MEGRHFKFTNLTSFCLIFDSYFAHFPWSTWWQDKFCKPPTAVIGHLSKLCSRGNLIFPGPSNAPALQQWPRLSFARSEGFSKHSGSDCVGPPPFFQWKEEGAKGILLLQVPAAAQTHSWISQSWGCLGCSRIVPWNWALGFILMAPACFSRVITWVEDSIHIPCFSWLFPSFPPVTWSHHC